MSEVDLKIVKIGNSRGIRLPAAILQRYGFEDEVVMITMTDGIMLQAKRAAKGVMSWRETAAEMAAAGESWEEWDETVGDGLAAISWHPAEVAEEVQEE